MAKKDEELQRGIDAYLPPRWDYHTEGLRALLAVVPQQPCCCIRCRAVVSAERFEHHWVVHEMQIDSMGAPGSTRWCPAHVNVLVRFGLTGIKAEPRKKW